jgi:PAS domain S-box-containing protein
MKPDDKYILPNDRIYPILVTRIYERSNIGILATVANALILVFVLWGRVEHGNLAIWLSMVMLLSLIRFILNLQFIKTVDKDRNIRRWGQLLFVGLGISGILWGSTAFILFPVEEPAYQVIIVFVLGGMAAGAVGVFSPIIPVFLVFTIPALLPITLRFFIIGDELHLAMSAMTMLFGILLYLTAKRISVSTSELISLKETFSDQLAKRTGELENANNRLRQEVEQRRETEQELADSEQRLSDIIEFLPDPTWVIDIEGRVIAWNKAMESLSDITKKEILGKGDYAYAVPFYGEPRPVLIDLVLKRDAKTEKEYLTFKEQDGVTIESESFHPTMGNDGCYFHATASILYNATGNIIGAIESVRDITFAKRSEEEREKLIGELQDALAKVRTLSGLLPICASCKKIRDDQGYWNQIESFISEHSTVEFSHGICPECAKKLYPDLF